MKIGFVIVYRKSNGVVAITSGHFVGIVKMAFLMCCSLHNLLCPLELKKEITTAAFGVCKRPAASTQILNAAFVIFLLSYFNLQSFLSFVFSPSAHWPRG